MENNEILYGTDKTERIVSVEVKDNVATVFVENNGEITKYNHESSNWILSSTKIDDNFEELSGNLHYKFIRLVEDNTEFYQLKQFYKNEDIFFINNAKERFLVTEGLTYHKGLKHTEPSILSFDIETTGLFHDNNSKVLLIANTFRKNNQIIKKMFSYDDYKNQRELIEDWCEWVRLVDPSIITGHNINLYDFPYIAFIARECRAKLKLGRDESNVKFNTYDSEFRKDQTQRIKYRKINIYGREVVDTFFLSIKYDIATKKYDNYKLKNIIAQEGLEKENRTFYDASQIRYKYQIPEEWEKIKSYAADDGDDALALYDLMSAPIFYSAQIIPKPYQLITESATGSQINSIMLRSYLKDKHSLPKATQSIQYEGAISIGNPGIYKNVFKIDVASLYPSIMIQYEVYDKDKDPKGHFLTVVNDLTEQRLNNKRLAKETNDRYYKDIEQSQKILINSTYGFLNAKGLVFNAPEKAAFITATGREILETAIDWCKNKGFKLVNADTDSISFSKGDESFITKEERHELLKEVNGHFPARIKFEDDGFYKFLICIKAKNYIMQTEDGKIKYKGSSIKAVGKEVALQEYIKEIIDSILQERYNYLEIYNKYIKEILNISDIKRWSSKKTISTKILNGTRKNETNVKDAIEDSEYVEGDKIFTYYNEEDKLTLIEYFDGKYNKKRLLEKLYKTAVGFENILQIEQFLNYSLKRNNKLLEENFK